MHSRAGDDSLLFCMGDRTSIRWNISNMQTSVTLLITFQDRLQNISQDLIFHLLVILFCNEILCHGGSGGTSLEYLTK